MLIVFVAVHTKYDYVFAENGLMAFKDGKLIEKQVQCSALFCVSYIHIFFFF
jgi:hypothetical protein